MASAISSDTLDFFREILQMCEPYPLSVLDDMMLDDKRFDERRLGATEALKCLIDAGYSEDEVNPWKNKQ